MNDQLKSLKKLNNNVEYFEIEVIDTSKLYIKTTNGRILSVEDKIRISLFECLLKNLKLIEKKQSWISPLGIFITIIIVFTTSTFKPFLGLSPNLWFAIFIIGGAVTFLWLILCIKEALGVKKTEDIVVEETEKIIKEFKKSSIMKKRVKRKS